MTRCLRHAGLVAILAASALTSLSASRPPRGDENDAPYVAISSMLGRLPNIDPLVDPFPFFLVRPWQETVPMTNTVVRRGGELSLDLPLDIQAMNFSGTIFLEASCYQCSGIPFEFTVIPEQITVGATVATAPAGSGAAVARFSESVLSSGGDGASMRIPTASAVVKVATFSPSPGSFLAVVRACQTRGCDSDSSLGEGYFVLSKVVIPGDQPIGDCPNVASPDWTWGAEEPPGYQKPDVLPLEQFLRGLFIEKRRSPEKRSYKGAVFAPSSDTGWEIQIEKPPVSTSGPPISPTESVVRLENPTSNLRSLVAVSSNCRITGNIVLNPGDPPRELRISRSNTTTIVLTGDSQAFGRFSDNNFWTLFGGRKVTLTAVN